MCTCGNSFGMYGPASECVEPCQGDYKQYCGGLGAHAVFKADGQLLYTFLSFLPRFYLFDKYDKLLTMTAVPLDPL